MLLHVSNGLAFAFLVGGFLSMLLRPAFWIIAASVAFLIYVAVAIGQAHPHERERE